MAKQYKKYEEVPWYRKNWFNSLLVFLGIFFAPFLWWVCINLMTGDIYQNDYDKEGKIKRWSVANKIAAWVILSIQILVVILLVLKPWG